MRQTRTGPNESRAEHGGEWYTYDSDIQERKHREREREREREMYTGNESEWIHELGGERL